MGEPRAMLDEARRLPMTLARLDALDAAVRAADAANDDVISVEAREEVLDTCFYVSDSERTLTAFTWLLAQHDKSPSTSRGWRTDQLLWRYKWVVGALTDFPQVSRARIDAVTHDLERRFRAAGNQMRGVHTVRLKLALRLGELDVATAELDRLRATPRDRLSDCRACEADSEVEVLLALGRFDEALIAAEPILDGRLRCAEVPAWTYAQLAVPLLEHGQVEAALAMHAKGVAAANALGEKASVLAWHHIQFFAMTGSLVKALNLVRKHWARAALQQAGRPRDVEMQMKFHAVLALVARKLVNARKKSVRLRVPEGLGLASHEGSVVVADLDAFAVADSFACAAAFDARNGNRSAHDFVARIHARADTIFERRADDDI